jgi:hypothetical protein
MENTTPSEEILWLEAVKVGFERPIWEWKIDNLLAEPNYSINELDELDPWIWENINEIIKNKTIWKDELMVFKNIVIWRLDILKIDANTISLKDWLTLQDYFYSIESLN